MAVRITLSDHLRADGLSWQYADVRVFADLSLTVAPGQRLGLVGENGVGKSTLLRLLAGAPDPAGVADGVLTRPPRLGHLEQEPPFAPHEPVGALIERALAEVRAIEAEFDAAAAALAGDDPVAADRFERALGAAEQADVWSVESRRDAILGGLGVAGIPLDRPLGEVSGGQRSRFGLAALLLSAPDALLLDEPTNHLDDDAAAFLEARLTAWRGPVLVASHDRAFLDAIATGLVDLDPAAGASGRPPVVFGGTFSEYQVHREAERVRYLARFEAEQEELKRLRLVAAETARSVAPGRGPRDNDKFIHKFKGARNDAAISRRVRDAEQRIAVLERDQLRKPRDPLVFSGLPAGSHALGEAGGRLVQASGVALPGRLAPVSLAVEPETRMLVTGPNGAGKSSLIGVLAGRLAPASGSVERRRGLTVGVLEQDVRFADPARSPRERYLEAVGERRAAAVPLASLGLIASRDLDRPIGSLSVGQQRRLALALVIARPPHLFLLDEPTNHLSLQLATDLEAALGTYPGAVLIASHDRWLRRRWAGEQLALAPA